MILSLSSLYPFSSTKPDYFFQMKGLRVLERDKVRISARASQSRVRGNNIRGELAELVADHLLGDGQVVVDLAVVDLELEADKGGQDRGGAGLGPDGHHLLAHFGADDGETARGVTVRRRFAWVGGDNGNDGDDD